MIYWLSRKMFEIVVFTMYRFNVYGRENLPKAPYLIAANHSSIADPPFVGIACKKDAIDFMAKKELFDRPFFGKWCRLVGCIEVRRGDNAVKSLKEAIRRLEKGRVVAIFPEGTRSDDGDLGSAKRGTGFLIAKAAVPVVPVYISGSAKALPKSGKIVRGSHVGVYIGKPVMPEDFTAASGGSKKAYDVMSSTVMDRINALKKEAERTSCQIRPRSPFQTASRA